MGPFFLTAPGSEAILLLAIDPGRRSESDIMMTGRERIMNALRGEATDRVPVMLHNFMLAAREAGISMADFRRDGRTIADCFTRTVETYGVDGVLIDIDTTVLAGAVGVPIDYPDDLPARTSGPLLESLAAVRSLRTPRLEDARSVASVLDAVRILKERFGGAVAIRANGDQCPFSLAGSIRGLEGWLMDLVEAPEEGIFSLLEYCCAVTIRYHEMLAEAGSDILSNGDSPAGPAVLSPAMYRKFAWPYEKRVAAAARKLGRPYILHICGDTGLILSDMAATGADGLELDYKTDVRLAREAFGGRTTFVGNIDPSGVLAMGTPAVVEKATRELLEVFGGEPRFILNAGCAIPAETPAANVAAMIAAARAFR